MTGALLTPLTLIDIGANLAHDSFDADRDAHTDFLALLRAHPAAASSVVLHCFTGGPQELEDCLALGLSIGVSGRVCDERRGQALRENRRIAPLTPPAGWPAGGTAAE